VREVAEAFYDMMVDGFFIPNSPTLMNAGKGNGLSTRRATCCRRRLDGGDLDSVKAAAIITSQAAAPASRSRGCARRTTSWPPRAPRLRARVVPQVFNSATEAVKQGGTRRGANMGILRVDHPDVLEFIDCKLEGGITNFNISVAVTTPSWRRWPRRGVRPRQPAQRVVTERLSAREVFERMVRAAWRTGDPGMVFIDRINASPANPTPEIGVVEATNPCGEQPLCRTRRATSARSTCRSSRAERGGEWSIDWDEMERVTRLAVRFLDDVIEMNRTRCRRSTRP